jgi:hypothetical protein
MTPDMAVMEEAVELFDGVRPAARALELPASTVCMVRYGDRTLSPERRVKARAVIAKEQARQRQDEMLASFGRTMLDQLRQEVTTA